MVTETRTLDHLITTRRVILIDYTVINRLRQLVLQLLVQQSEMFLLCPGGGGGAACWIADSQ